MEKIGARLTEYRSFLTQCRKEIHAISKNSRVTGWQIIDHRRIKEILDLFGLPPEVVQARDNYREKSLILLQQIDRIENDLGNLEADYNHLGKVSEDAGGQLDRIQKDCHALEGPLVSLRADIQILCAADQAVRGSLNFHRILPLAGRHAQSKIQFEGGLRIYKAFTPKNDDEKDHDINIHQVMEETLAINNQLLALQLEDTHKLTAAIVNHEVNIARNAGNVVNHHLNCLKESLDRRMIPLEAVRTRLDGIRHLPLPELLRSLGHICESGAAVVSSLNHQFQALEKLDFLVTLLSDLKFLDQAVKKSLLPRLNQALESSDSCIHPGRQAETMAGTYFAGFRGIARIIRMLFSSFFGGRFVSEQELRHNLEVSLKSCPIFYGKDQSDIEKLEKFIDAYLNIYDRPFPHDGMFQLMKKNIEEYGSKVESHIRQMEVALPDDGTRQLESFEERTIPFGKLIRRIEMKTEHLIKENP